MSKDIIPQDIKITKSMIKELLYKQFNIVVQQIKLLGEGWDNSVYLINNNLVFRFPRRKEGILLIEREMSILPLLQENIALKIPTPKYFGQPSNLFSRPFYGHKLIHGHSGCSVSLKHVEYKQLAVDLALFLKSLHEIDIKQLALPCELDPVFNRTDVPSMLKNLEGRLVDIKKHYDLSSYTNKFDLIIKNISSYKMSAMKKITHGDLYHRHLLFDDKHSLSAVIDWGDCSIGDSVVDLAVVFQFLPKNHHEIFFAEYGYVDNNTADYAKFLGLYYAITLLWYAHYKEDKALIKTSHWTLEEL